MSSEESKDHVVRVILVCNVLPIRMRVDASGFSCMWDESFLFGFRGCFGLGFREMTRKHRIMFVGCPPIFVPDERQEEVVRVLADFNCYPGSFRPCAASPRCRV